MPGISLCCYQDLLLFPGTFSNSHTVIIAGLVIGLLLFLAIIITTVKLKGKVQVHSSLPGSMWATANRSPVSLRSMQEEP